MTIPLSSVYHSLSPGEQKQLDLFRERALFFIGREIHHSDFWQEFIHMFFVFHYDIGDGTTVIDRRDVQEASAQLYQPSLFDRYTGKFVITGEKVSFSSPARKNLSWVRKRTALLSFFQDDDDGISFVDPNISLIVPSEGMRFFNRVFKKMKKSVETTFSAPFFMFVVTILLLKRELYAPAKKYRPFSIEEFLRIREHYEDIAQRFI